MARIKYVMINEVTSEVVKDIVSPFEGVELYADEAIRIMQDDPKYDENYHALYLKVGGQEKEFTGEF